MFAAATRCRAPRTPLDWAILASVALMVAMNLVVLFGDFGSSAAYAAVPM